MAPTGTAARDADRLLIGTFRSAGGWVALTMLAGLADLALGLGEPYVLARSVDAVIHQNDPARWLGVLGILLAAKALIRVVDVIAGMNLVAGIAARLRRRLVDQVLAQGLTGRQRHQPGDLANRLLADVDRTAAFVPAVLGSLTGMGTAVGGCVALVLIDPRLVVPVAAGLLGISLVARRPITEMTSGWTAYSCALGSIADGLTDALRGALSIRAAGNVEDERARVLRPLAQLSAHGRGLWETQRRMVLRFGLFAPVIQIAVLAVAGFGVAAGRISAGEFLATVAYLSMAMGLLSMTSLIAAFSDARSGAGRLAEVLAAPVPDDGATLSLPAGTGVLKLRRTTVIDSAGAPVLTDVELTVPGGAMLAVVGAAGSGAGALIEVVAGLRPPDRGTVLLDGVPVAALARGIGVALARPCLLGPTLREALAADPDPDPADLADALRDAAVDGFVSALPHGLDTIPAELPMSGGEAQRLGLARALTGGPRLLVLEDATSSLDTATEAAIYRALAARGATRLVLTHRAAVAARADLIAWLRDGHLVTVAPHAQLWLSPEYRAAFAEELA